MKEIKKRLQTFNIQQKNKKKINNRKYARYEFLQCGKKFGFKRMF